MEKKVLLIILASALGSGIIFGSSAYYFTNKSKQTNLAQKKENVAKLENEIKNLKDQVNALSAASNTSEKKPSLSGNTSNNNSSSNSKSTTESPAVTSSDATAGWQTYTNRDIGYILKYPQEWTLTETDTWTEDNRHVRYVTITNQDNSIHPISVHWGFVRNGTYLYSTDRTGVGAGDITEVTSNMPILGASIKKTKLTFEGKIKEYFYTPKTQPADYTWEASIATRDNVNNTASNNLADYSEVDMAEAILSNVQLMF